MALEAKKFVSSTERINRNCNCSLELFFMSHG